MADDQQGRDDPRDHDDMSGKPSGNAKGNGADADNPDALDDLLGTDVRDAARVLTFDRLRSDGLTTDQAVTRMITDGILLAEEGPRFAHLYRDRPVQPKRSGGKAKGAGAKANGRGKANGQAGNHPGFDAEATSRLTSWLPEIAIGLGLDPGRDLDIRPDGSWHCRTNPGYGDGALDLIRHMRNADADTFASKWLATHSEDGLFTVADDLGDNSAEDQGRQLEVERIWQNAQPALGTIAEDFLICLRFDTQTITTLRPDIGTLRMVDHWSGGDPALAAPTTASDGSLIALHLQPLDRMSGAAKGEPRNKRGKARWLNDGLIRLGNHGEGRSTTLHMAMRLADALALRAAGMDRVAAPPRPEYLGRAAIPPDIENVVIAGTRSEETQRGLARLFAQRVPVRFAELSSGSAAGLLAISGPAALAAAMAVYAPLYQRGDDAFVDEIFGLDDVEFRLIGEPWKRLKKRITNLPAWQDIVSARGKARKLAVEARRKAEAKQELQVETAKTAIHSEEQDLETLLDDIVTLLRRYVTLPPTAAWALALFVVYSSLYGEFEHAIRIWFYSAEPSSGKTTAAMLVMWCCPKWKRSDSITSSSFYRFVNENPGAVIFLNEANEKVVDDTMLTDLLSSGFEKGSRVDRTDKDDKGRFTQAEMHLFCPVVLAGLNELTPALKSRSLKISMQPQPPESADEAGDGERRRRLTRTARQTGLQIAARVARWCQDNRERVKQIAERMDEIEEHKAGDPNGITPDWLVDRDFDKMLPLFVVASLAGERWQRRMEQAALRLSPVKGRDDLSIGKRLLIDALDVLLSNLKVVTAAGGITPDVLRRALLEEDSGTWKEFVDPSHKHAPPRELSETRLGKELGRYCISRRRVRGGGSRAYMYPLEQFVLAFKQYLATDSILMGAESGAAGKIAEIEKIIPQSSKSGPQPGDTGTNSQNQGVNQDQTQGQNVGMSPGSKPVSPRNKRNVPVSPGLARKKASTNVNSLKKARGRRRDGAPGKSAERRPKAAGGRPSTPDVGEDI